MVKKAFDFIPISELPPKPRDYAITEIRGGYRNIVGINYMKDLFQDAGDYIDVFKFAGGTQRLLDKDLVKRKIAFCHDHGINVSTGEFTERALVTMMKKDGKLFLQMAPNFIETFEKYLDEAKHLDFDIVEISDWLIKSNIDIKTKLELVQTTVKKGLKAKPQVSVGYYVDMIQKKTNVSKVIEQVKSLLSVGAWKITVQSEGITEKIENEEKWQVDVVYDILKNLDATKLIFKADYANATQWYIRNFGAGLNFFIDHSQVMELALARTKTWAKKSTWDTWWQDSGETEI